MEECLSNNEQELKFIDIRDIFFGFADGKKEAEDDKFLETFFDYRGMYSKLLSGRYLILGSKGSGKTLLIEYFKKKKTLEGNLFVDIKLDQFIEKKQIIEKEKLLYNKSSLLKWLVYIELTKKILKTDSIQRNNHMDKLERFMKKNKFDLSLESEIILDSMLQDTSKGAFSVSRLLSLDFSFIKNCFKRAKIGEYYHYIREIEDCVNEALKESNFKNTIYIVFDELDEFAKLSDLHLDVLNQLIEIFRELNTKWSDNKINMRMIVSMRKDIYMKLDSVSTSKIKEDYGIVLDWGTAMSISSPLFDLICHKVRKSNPDFSNLKNSTIFEKTFGFFTIKVHNKKINTLRYILTKGFIRPRDIVVFFSKLQSTFEGGRKVFPRDIKNILNDYSEYLYLEVQNESKLFMSNLKFQDSMNLLKDFRNTTFSFLELKNYFLENRSSYKSITEKTFENDIKNLFDIGVIGNVKTINGHTGKVFFRFQDVEINKNERFSIHYGLRNYLKLSLEKI